MTGLIAVMPGIVIGSVLIFSTCFIFISGIQVIATRLFDTRRTLIVGLAVITYLVILTYPGALVSTDFSLSTNAVVSSTLTMGSASALLLNLVFRLGIRRRVDLMLRPGFIDHDALEAFFLARGATWGVRRDVMAKVTYAVIQSA